ncbi:MAG: translation initiation factor IF-2, partial [Pyrinomonadaceae bacterium]|nr:translation initiation factor IF-2 [Pyrinomonadaceae bacterium]
MATGKGSSMRVYDLAREVKQDTKRVMEDLRREGADVSVASNTVSFDLAEKVRNKYFPKVEAAPKRGIKVIKKAAKPVEETPVEVEVEPIPEEAVEVPVVVKKTAKPQEEKAAAAPTRQVKKLAAKKPVAEAPEPEPVAEPAPTKPSVKKLVKTKVEEPAAEPVEVEPAAEAEPEAAPPEPVAPRGTTVKKLTLSPDAIKRGIKAGDRLVTDAPTKTGSLAEGVRPQYRGTPGETTAPQMTYTPPADNRRRPGRSGGRRGRPEDKGKFAERDIDAPQKRSIEERILDQVGAIDNDNLKVVRLVEGATVREFAEALGITPRDIVQLLIKRGVFATLNQPIGEKMATEMAFEYGIDLTFVPFEEMVIEEEFEELIAADADDVEFIRAPVVTVMGHVDHGKTSLLDAIRSDNVAEGEAGGITQHIGAYSVMVPNSDNPDEPRRVVFLDTPGHEAFTMMRARGAKATDIVVLVVAADDGVMPQTIEAVEHSKAAGVPIIVAINKIDKPDANPDKVKQGLAGLGLQPTDWGGETEMVPVSAKKKENLNTLLETVLLQADILELKASPTRRASGVVLEAKLDKGRGPVATALVQQGTLHVGDPFIVGQFSGKVRAMISDRGETVTEAAPATPVEILGLQGVPQAGDTFQVVADVEKAQDIARQRQMHVRQAAMLKTTKRGIESLG